MNSILPQRSPNSGLPQPVFTTYNDFRNWLKKQSPRYHFNTPPHKALDWHSILTTSENTTHDDTTQDSTTHHNLPHIYTTFQKIKGIVPSIQLLTEFDHIDRVSHHITWSSSFFDHHRPAHHLAETLTTYIILFILWLKYLKINIIRVKNNNILYTIIWEIKQNRGWNRWIILKYYKVS